MQPLLNLWRIPELRNRILFTLAMLVIYRIGFHIPLPVVDPDALKAFMEGKSQGLLGGLMAYMSTFTGGSLQQSTIFGLGVAPYISASIIIQLLATVLPDLKAMRKEGPSGQQKIMEYTRYLTIALAIVQGVVWLGSMYTISAPDGRPLVYPEFSQTWIYWVGCITALVGGSMFLMWLGEQIDKNGLGNGVSLIITAGIVASIPTAIEHIVKGFQISSSAGAEAMKAGFIVALFILVVAGSIIITQAQRQIPIQQAKHTKGTHVVGGQKMYLPLKVNHGGVMPVIFASTLMMFPAMLLGALMKFVVKEGSGDGGAWQKTVQFLSDELAGNKMNAGFLYLFLFIALIYFFSYFWTSVQFNPEETATNLRDGGSFIPGLRPGPRTAEYLEAVMERLTYVGAAFLCLIAILPNLASHGMQITDYQVMQFMGGTSLLICVSVVLDFVQRIEAQLMMRNYQGFLSASEAGSATKIKAVRGESALVE